LSNAINGTPAASAKGRKSQKSLTRSACRACNPHTPAISNPPRSIPRNTAALELTLPINAAFIFVSHPLARRFSNPVRICPQDAASDIVFLQGTIEGNSMGITHVTVAVRNPAIPDRTWEGLFLVDTGAVDSLVPGKHLRELGFNPKSQRTDELADGSQVKLAITTGELEFMGEIVGSTIIFGADDAEPILGVTALESVGIEVDPRSQCLKRLPAARLK
jgi:clan AA aspartic protease